MADALALLRSARAELLTIIDEIDASSAPLLPPPDLPYTRMSEPRLRGERQEGEGVPGRTWVVPCGDYEWRVQAPVAGFDPSDPSDQFIYVESPDENMTGDFVPVSPTDARRLARALMAAVARTTGVASLDERGPAAGGAGPEGQPVPDTAAAEEMRAEIEVTFDLLTSLYVEADDRSQNMTSQLEARFWEGKAEAYEHAAGLVERFCGNAITAAGGSVGTPGDKP